MDRFRAVRRVLWITMGLNLVATAAKLIVGYWTGSLSLVADGFDSLFDAASNVIGLVGIYLAVQPADEDHPYGHRKAETMTTLIISSLLFLTTWELMGSAVERLRTPTLVQAEVNVWSFAALLVSIAVHAGVVWYELRAGRRLHSEVLVADALHTRADIFVSISVLGGLVAVRLGYPIADPILALVVAVVIAKIGIDIIRESSPTLVDKVAVSPERVRQIAASVPGVISCHKVRSRGQEGDVYVDLHIQVDPATSTEEAHAIAHRVQLQLRQQLPTVQDVTIHAEPAGPIRGEPGQADVGLRVRRLAEELGIMIHDVWIYDEGGSYHVHVHAEAEGSLSLREAHRLVSSLEERAHGAVAHLAELTAHIEPLAQLIHVPEEAASEADVVRTIQQVVSEIAEPASCHQIEVHGSDRERSVSMHCDLPAEISLADAHRFTVQLETQLRASVPGLERVVIHTEPAGE